MTQDTPRTPSDSTSGRETGSPPAEDRDAPVPLGASGASRTAILGAVFLMATSAIGPGFITQTANYTITLGAAFACAIVISILVDVAVQMNVWSVVGVSGMRAHELGNAVLPGVGYVLAGLVVLGGLVFNIGNIGRHGSRAERACSASTRGSVERSPPWSRSAIFLSRRAGVALDRIVVGLGLLMIVADARASRSPPRRPWARRCVSIVAPDTFDFVAVTTIIGGTVGGYITYAGAHRLLDSGLHRRRARRATSPASSVISILVTGVMRVLLFLAILGVVDRRGRARDRRRRRSGRCRVPGGRGRGGAARLRRDPVVRRADVRDRGGVHLGVVPDLVERPPSAPARCSPSASSSSRAGSSSSSSRRRPSC